MLAVVYSEYGGPERLCLTQVPEPAVGPEDLLVRVQAVSLNASDVEFLRGKPAYTRAWGLTKPKHSVLGSDVAGVVERVGDKVTRFAPGDAVFADLLEVWGGLAQFVSAPERLWAPIPAGLTPDRACAIPQAGVVAWQALEASAPLEGKRVLVVGAAGGSGTFAVQFAKLRGASKVIGVDRAAKVGALAELGADETLALEHENYWERREYADVIVDLVGSRGLSDNWRVLAPGGTYRLVGGPLGRLLGAASVGPVRSLFSSKSGRLLVVRQSPAAFTQIAQLCLEGKIRTTIGARYAFGSVREAFEALYSGKVLGKVVIDLTRVEEDLAK